MQRILCLLLLIIVSAGCGSYSKATHPTAPGDDRPAIKQCFTYRTNWFCISRGQSNTIAYDITVYDRRDSLTAELPFRYKKRLRGQGAQLRAYQQDSTQFVVFDVPRRTCEVIPDALDVDGVVWRTVYLTGLPSGTWNIQVVHGLDIDCYRQEISNRTADHWAIADRGTVTLCTLYAPSPQ